MDVENHYFMNNMNEEIPLRIKLTKREIIVSEYGIKSYVEFHHDLPNIKVGESLHFNIADYFPEYNLRDQIYVSAFLESNPTKLFLSPQGNTSRKISSSRILRNGDYITLYADVCFTRFEQPKDETASMTIALTPLQDVYKVIYCKNSPPIYAPSANIEGG